MSFNGAGLSPAGFTDYLGTDGASTISTPGAVATLDSIGQDGHVVRGATPRAEPSSGHRSSPRPGPTSCTSPTFTYVPMDGGGFGYTALVIDAFAGLITGWECSLSKETAFVERAIRQAAVLRRR